MNARGEPRIGHSIAAEIPSADRIDLVCAFIRWHGIRVIDKPLREFRDAGPAAADHHDRLHGLDRTEGARSPRRARRSCEGLLRDSGDPPSREGLAVPAGLRILHGVRRILEPHPHRSCRRRRVERPDRGGRDPRAAREVPRDVRLLLGRPVLRGLRPGSIRKGHRGDPPRLPGRVSRARRPSLSRISSRSSSGSRPSERSTADIGTSSWRRPAPARPSSPRSTTDDLRRMGQRPTLSVRRSPPRDPPAEPPDLSAPSCTTPTSARSSSREKDRPSTATSSRRSSPCQGRSRSLPPRHFEVVIVDEFHHAEADTYRRLLDHLEPAELLGLTATPERADERDVLAQVRRPLRVGAPPLGRPRGRSALPVPVLRPPRRHRHFPRSPGAGRATTPKRLSASTPPTTLAPAS